MPRREELYLADILAACRHVTRFVDGLDLDAWIEEEVVQFAVLQRLAVIGEAAQRLGPSVRDRYPAVPWRDLVAFRNLAVHDYFAIDRPLVWAIASRDVPVLRGQVEGILAADYPLVLAILDSA